LLEYRQIDVVLGLRPDHGLFSVHVSQPKVVVNGFPWNDHKGGRIGTVGRYAWKECHSFARSGHRIADLISKMECGDETHSFIPISPFLMPCFIGIENKMSGHTVDTLNNALKIVNNPSSVTVIRRSSAGPPRHELIHFSYYNQ
jgi:hypothetical protein